MTTRHLFAAALAILAAVIVSSSLGLAPVELIATAGATLTNTGKAETYAPGGGKPGLATVTDDAKIDVVRPDLVIVKDAAPGIGDAGNVVTYTVTLSHAAGSTSPASLVNLSDVLPPGATLSSRFLNSLALAMALALNVFLIGAPSCGKSMRK